MEVLRSLDIQSFFLSRWYWIVAFKRNGNGAAPNNTMRNVYVIILSGWLTGRAGSLSHRNLVATLSSSFSSIYKKAFSMSTAKAFWLIRKVNSISCIRLEPVCRQSLRLNAVGDFFADAW